MADVIDFSNQLQEDPVRDDSDKTVCKIALDELNKELDNLKDLFIFYVDKRNKINIIETDVSLQDRSFMLQLLQHHINLDLLDGDEDETILEPDL